MPIFSCGNCQDRVCGTWLCPECSSMGDEWGTKVLQTLEEVYSMLWCHSMKS